jgi:hypothetical protein
METAKRSLLPTQSLFEQIVLGRTKSQFLFDALEIAWKTTRPTILLLCVSVAAGSFKWALCNNDRRDINTDLPMGYEVRR